MTRRTFLSGTATALAAVAAPLPPKTVVLSFDDAVASHATVVAPMLKHYNFPASFYVCEFPPDFADKTKYMTWEQIKGLHEQGFEIGNHTRTHAHVDKLSPSQLNAELVWVEDKLQSLGIPKPVSFAYPSYKTSPGALGVLKSRGYQLARAGLERPYDPQRDDPLLIPSFTVHTEAAPIIKAMEQTPAGQATVLCIHGVPDTAHPWVTTPPAVLEEWLRYLQRNKYTVLSMRDLLHYLPKKAPTA